MVRKEIDQLYVQEVQAEGPTQEMKSKIEMLTESLAETTYKTGEETCTKHSYLHMLTRMKKDFIAAKISSTENDAALRNKASILDLE